MGRRVATAWPDGENAYAYFNNDPNAAAFAALARASGLTVARTPSTARG